MELWRTWGGLAVGGPRVQRDSSGRKGKEEGWVTVGEALLPTIRGGRRGDAMSGTVVCSNRSSAPS